MMSLLKCLEPIGIVFPEAVDECFPTLRAVGEAHRRFSLLEDAVGNVSSTESTLRSALDGHGYKRVFQLFKDETILSFNVLVAVFHRIYNRLSVSQRRKLLNQIANSSGMYALPIEQLAASTCHVSFEDSLPAPNSYVNWAREKVSQHPLAYARLRGESPNCRIEGCTKVDALITWKDIDFTLLIEAKYLSDIAYSTDYGPVRNQLARTIDVALEASNNEPARFAVILLTPRLFKDKEEGRFSRLYGHKMHAYLNAPESLRVDLPHRFTGDGLQPSQLAERLGWVTWEAIYSVICEFYGACQAVSDMEMARLTNFLEQRRLIDVTDAHDVDAVRNKGFA